MEKTKMILSIAGIGAVIFLAISILLHGHVIGGYGMRNAAPYSYEHGGWGYHH